jgi:hypothetical protein
MKMADVRVGMKLRSKYSSLRQQIIMVTELTEKGFRYVRPRWHLGSRIGWTEGGEHYGFNGESMYEPVEADFAI